MVSIQETKEVSNIFVAKIFLELLAIIFDTFIIDHTVFVCLKLKLVCVLIWSKKYVNPNEYPEVFPYPSLTVNILLMML